MILVDTSVWIPFLEGRNSPGATLLDQRLDEGADVAICDVVAMEVVQGAASEVDAQTISNLMKTALRLVPADPLATHLDAALLYHRCRRQGVTVRSSIDTLIAALAIEHDVPLLSEDADFEKIGWVEPRLRLLGRPN